MTYKDGEPLGRFCLEGNGKYSKSCDFPIEIVDQIGV